LNSAERLVSDIAEKQNKARKVPSTGSSTSTIEKFGIDTISKKKKQMKRE
jgi:hypothetical protein